MGVVALIEFPLPVEEGYNPIFPISRYASRINKHVVSGLPVGQR
jgi:hypothetical protein